MNRDKFDDEICGNCPHPRNSHDNKGKGKCSGIRSPNPGAPDPKNADEILHDDCPCDRYKEKHGA